MTILPNRPPLSRIYTPTTPQNPHFHPYSFLHSNPLSIQFWQSESWLAPAAHANFFSRQHRHLVLRSGWRVQQILLMGAHRLQGVFSLPPRQAFLSMRHLVQFSRSGFAGMGLGRRRRTTGAECWRWTWSAGWVGTEGWRWALAADMTGIAWSCRALTADLTRDGDWCRCLTAFRSWIGGWFRTPDIDTIIDGWSLLTVIRLVPTEPALTLIFGKSRVGRWATMDAARAAGWTGATGAMVLLKKKKKWSGA